VIGLFAPRSQGPWNYVETGEIVPIFNLMINPHAMSLWGNQNPEHLACATPSGPENISDKCIITTFSYFGRVKVEMIVGKGMTGARDFRLQ